MTLPKTWTLPTGEVLSVVPGSPDRYGAPQGSLSKYAKVAMNGGEPLTVRSAMAAADEARRAEQRRIERAEIAKSLKGKRPPKPKRPEPLYAPEGTVLYFTGAREDEVVSSVSSVSDTGSSKQVYYSRPGRSMMEQAAMKCFALFTPEERATIVEASRIRDEHAEDLRSYPRGYIIDARVDSNGDLVAIAKGEGRTVTRTYPIGFLDSQDVLDPEIVVDIQGIVYPVETNNVVTSATQAYWVALAADLGLVRPDRLGYRLDYEFVRVDQLADWEVLMTAYSQANEVVSTLAREAQGRAASLLLAYETTFVSWKVDVAEWEREWKS